MKQPLTCRNVKGDFRSRLAFGRPGQAPAQPSYGGGGCSGQTRSSNSIHRTIQGPPSRGPLFTSMFYPCFIHSYLCYIFSSECPCRGPVKIPMIYQHTINQYHNRILQLWGPRVLFFRPQGQKHMPIESSNM